MSETKKKCTSIRVSEMSDEPLTLAAKFRAFRLEAEFTGKKLKEAELVIEQLENELIFSRDTEKNLRSQIISSEDRLICLQETLKKFLIVSEQQRQNEEVYQTTERKIEECREKIDQIREEVKNLIECVSIDTELREKNKTLKSELAAIGKENDLMKAEIQNLMKEKRNMETEFQQKLKNLETDLEKAIKKENETKIDYCDMLLYYKEQIKEYEQKVECYEKERKSLLEDFELPNSHSNHIVREGSTDIQNSEDRSLEYSNAKNRNGTDEEIDEERDTQIFQCSAFQGKPKRVRFKKEKAANISKMPMKQKPKLEFLTASQDLLRPPSSVEFGRKRRLFSTNCNHYID